MQAIILFKNLDFFPTKSQNDAWQPPKPLKLNIFEFIYRGCQLLTRKCHRTKFFARLAARLLKHILNSKGLKQSPWSTPRPTDINGVRNPDVMIELLKSVYRLLMID